MELLAAHWVLTVVMAFATGWLLTRPGKSYMRDTKKNPYGKRIGKDVWRNVSNLEELETVPHSDVTTMWEALTFCAKKRKDAPLLGSRELVKMHETIKQVPDPKNKDKKIDKKWNLPEMSEYKWKTAGECEEIARALGWGLRKLGLEQKDRLAICDDTKEKWSLTAYGAYSQSMVVVTVYVNLGEEKMVAALNECNVRVFQTDSAHLQEVLDNIDDLKDLHTLIITDSIEKGKGKKAAEALRKRDINVLEWEDVLETGRKERKGKEEEEKKVAPKPEDIAVIMYTSGTTGSPKGVIIKHKNMIANVAASDKVVTFDSDEDVYLAYLPLAHVLALILEACCIYNGVRIGYGTPRSLMDDSVKNCKGDVRALQPTIFPVVPAVSNKLKRAVHGKVGGAFLPLRWLFNFAFLSKKAAVQKGHSTSILDRLVFNKIKAQLGGRVRIMVSGGSALNADVHEFLRVCFGCDVLQGYGLTETCGGASIMYPDDPSTGRCGPPIPSSEIMLVPVPDMGYTLEDDPNPRGEIIVRGDNVVDGYYKNDEKSKESFKHGGFATGDIGEMYPDGTLKIVDRVKNLVKPPHGEYVALESLESAYKSHSAIEEICVYADSEHDDVIAIVVPDKSALQSKCGKGDYAKLCESKEARDFILECLDEMAQKNKFKPFEKVKNVRLSSEEWTPENDYLTAAMKLNRQTVKENYEEEIEEMYKELE